MKMVIVKDLSRGDHKTTINMIKNTFRNAHLDEADSLKNSSGFNSFHTFFNVMYIWILRIIAHIKKVIIHSIVIPVMLFKVQFK